MTLSIGAERRERARQPRGDDPGEKHRSKRLLRGIQIFTAVTALGAVGSLTTAFCLDDWRTAVAGGVLAVMSTAAGALWCLHNMLADREEFYRRGQLDGWFRGWHGQEPDAGDPLLK